MFPFVYIHLRVTFLHNKSLHYTVNNFLTELNLSLKFQISFPNDVIIKNIKENVKNKMLHFDRIFISNMTTFLRMAVKIVHTVGGVVLTTKGVGGTCGIANGIWF